MKWLARAHDEGGVESLRIGRRDEERIAEWPGLVRLIANADGSNPRYEIEEGAPPAAVSRVMNEIGHALLHQAAGGISLHASSVALGERAYSFVGLSGAGKSTLAAYLTESCGASLLADDGTTLVADPDPNKPILVLPTPHSNHALDDAARSIVDDARITGAIHARGVELEKTIATPRARTSTPIRLTAICILAWSDEPTSVPYIAHLSELDAIAHLIPHLVRFSVDDPVRLATELDVLGRLARGKMVVRLCRPRAFSSLEACRQLLLGIGYA